MPKAIRITNCCPSCTAMMVQRVGALPKDSPLFAGAPMVLCDYCGYCAPKQCFDSCDDNDRWRLQFVSGVLAKSSDEAEKSLRESVDEMIRQTTKLAY